MTTAIFCADRRGIFSRALILALLFAAVLPFGAFADEGTPPPPTEEPALPPEEGGEVAEEPAVDEPVIEEPVVEELVIEEPVVEEPVVEVPVVEDFAALLAELPVETEIVILSEDGEPLPMVSTEAAEVIASGDPMWCPVGVNPGGAACSTNYPSLVALVSDFVPTGNGVIWIQGGPDLGNNVTINGGVGGIWEAASVFTLALKGGWNGCNPTCVNTIDQNNPSVFDTIIEIINWQNDVTLSDIQFIGSIEDVPALSITTTGKIVLTRVDSSNNDGPGAYLDNSAAEGKDVTVTFGEFEDNGDGDANEYGLQIFSKGVITLSSIEANENAANGVYLGNSGAGTPKNVILTSGYFEFNNNGGNGLSVDSKGLITLKDIDAIHNGSSGVVLSNVASLTNQGVTFSGTNVFGENGLDGLAISSKGAITISNLIANENNRYGAFIDNSSPGTLAFAVTLTGNNEFKFNNERGLQIYSNGTINLNNLTATNNTAGIGVEVDNRSSTTNQGVNITGTNIFDFNGQSGVEIYSNGAVNVSNIHAFDNGFWGGGNGYGAYIDNHSSMPKSVTLTGLNTFESNNWSGLQIQSLGAITVNNIYSAYNNWTGAYLQNDFAGAVGGVTVTGTATFTTTGSGFHENGDNGLEITSRGAVTLKDFDAIGNGVRGVYINNSSGVGNVYVGTTIMPWRVGLLENGGAGLQIYSKGTITLNRVAAMSNFSDGAYLYNAYDGVVKTVTISTSGSDDLSRADFSSNGGNGLTVYSHGAITIAHLNASENGWNTSGGYGARIDNCLYSLGACTTTNPAAVTLNGDNTFSGNNSGPINVGLGLQISSKGAITVNNVIANDNDSTCVELNNDFPGATAGITVSNTSTYWPSFNSSAGSSGLAIMSRGSIILKDFDAIGNDEYGVFITNTNGTGNVSVGTSRTYWMNGVWNNGYSGIWIETKGTVTVWNIWAQDNNDYGVYIDNSAAGLPKAVNFNASSGSKPYSNLGVGNGLSGFYVLTTGAITMNKTEAWNNGWNASPFYEDGAGVYLDNISFGNPLSPQNVTLNGVDVGENYYSGIEVWTYGSIIANNIHAEDNGWGEALEGDRYGYGALLKNDFGFPKPVTLNGNNIFKGNWTGGLEIGSLDAIKVNNLEAWSNEGFGAYLYNTDVGAPKPITITGYGEAGENGSDGIVIESRGLITAAYLYADGNGWKGLGVGVTLDNAFTGAVGGIKVTGNNGFYSNYGYGLSATSFGAITMSNLRASENVGAGAYIDNDWAESISGATVTLTGTQAFNFNGGNGLLIFSKKVITVSNMSAEGNNYNGVYIENIDSGPGTPQNIVISGSNRFEENDMTGLVVYSYGSITINNLIASGNGWTDGGGGVWIENCIYDSFLDQCLAQASKPITLTGTNRFVNNESGGLVVWSLGAITVNNLSAYWNGLEGAILDNQWGQSTLGGFVTLTGTNELSHNGTDGLNIFTHGNITVNNLTASWNLNDGAILDNYGVSGPPVTVSMTGTNTFNGNGDWLVWAGVGLSVHSEGNIAINNLTANWNAEHGVVLNTIDYHYGLGNVTLSGVNTFLGNQEDGLQIEAWGAVTLNKVRADDNGGSGVYVYAEVGNTTIACGSMTDNGNYGWYLDTGTSITLKAVVALGNGINTWSNVTPIPFRSC